MAATSVSEAAAKIGIGERTLWRCMRKDDFHTAFLDARRQVVQLAVSLVQSGLNTAVDTLIEVMADGEAPASSRVSACRVMADLAFRGFETEDLEQRILNLEQMAASQQE